MTETTPTTTRLIHRTTGAVVTARQRRIDRAGGRNHNYDTDTAYYRERSPEYGDEMCDGSTGRSLSPKTVAKSMVDVVTYHKTPSKTVRGCWDLVEISRRPLADTDRF